MIEVFPKTERVVVEGLNMIKKHVRKNQDQPQGEIAEREGTIHWSNVVTEERYFKNRERDAALQPHPRLRLRRQKNDSEATGEVSG